MNVFVVLHGNGSILGHFQTEKQAQNWCKINRLKKATYQRVFVSDGPDVVYQRFGASFSVQALGLPNGYLKLVVAKREWDFWVPNPSPPNTEDNAGELKTTYRWKATADDADTASRWRDDELKHYLEEMDADEVVYA